MLASWELPRTATPRRKLRGYARSTHRASHSRARGSPPPPRGYTAGIGGADPKTRALQRAAPSRRDVGWDLKIPTAHTVSGVSPKPSPQPPEEGQGSGSPTLQSLATQGAALSPRQQKHLESILCSAKIHPVLSWSHPWGRGEMRRVLSTLLLGAPLAVGPRGGHMAWTIGTGGWIP